MGTKSRRNFLTEFVIEFFVILAVFVALASSFVIIINTLNANRDLTASPSSNAAER